MTIVLIIIAIIAVLVFIGMYSEKKRRRALRSYLKDGFGKYPPKVHSASQLKMLDSVLESAAAKDRYNGAFYIDDRTWYDLSMPEIFDRMDCCRTGYGMQELYSMLRMQLFDEEELKRRDSVISDLHRSEELRLELQMLLEDMSGKRYEPVTSGIDALLALDGSKIAVDLACLVAGIVSCFMIFYKPAVGFVMFLAALFFNIISYLNEKRRLSSAMGGYASIVRMIWSAHSLGEKLTGLKTENDELKTLLDSIACATGNLLPITKGAALIVKGRGATGGLIDLVLDYLRMFLHIDLMLLYGMRKKIAARGCEIIQLAEEVGRLDALTAVASFRESLAGESGFCRPDFSQKGICVKGLCHPLVKGCIKNDLKLTGSMLLTGSNASGKSTFLRSMALAALMAQTIYTVSADEYHAGFMRVASSMGISDNILEGDSYYLSEIKSIKRILDYADDDRAMLCVIDEVLKGTNTAERVCASAEILLSLAKKCICIAATHDLELADILSDDYENYHFLEMIDENDRIVFPYRLEKGACRSRNAIALLKIMGYPDHITERADDRCREFLKRSGDFI